MSLELAGEQRQNRVVPQLVVVVEVFVSQGDAHDALPHQRPDRVFRETGIAVVGEATCHLVQEPRERSISRSSSTPAFEVIAPPSNAAATLRPWHP